MHHKVGLAKRNPTARYMPFAFASHFAPAMLMQALEIYRARFKPNGSVGALTQPYAMVAVNVVVADTDDEAAYLFTS